jgi:tRNA(Glu) U13 pseudouridine synthase TruD
MTALHVPTPPTGEEEVGMLGFATSTPGTGGRLRAEPEDFVVIEESLVPVEIPGGRFTAVTIRLRNWETNRFVRQMSRRLGISSRRVRVAGVKDKRAGPPQLFTIEAPVDSVRALHMSDVEILSLMTYLVHEGSGETDEAREARRNLREDGDIRQALRDFPKNLGNERNLLEHLLHHPDDHKGAMERLPFNLQLMFIHAYQGVAFNLVVAERLRAGLPMDRPLEGDLLVPVDERGNPRHDQGIPVTGRNLAKVERQVARGRALVSGLVPGTEAPVAEGEMGRIERSVIERMGIEPGDFRIVDMTDLTSPGIRREIAMTGVDPAWELDDGRVTFSFGLQKGCYATCVLREFMKATKAVWPARIHQPTFSYSMGS